jgi:hypothetical protein
VWLYVLLAESLSTVPAAHGEAKLVISVSLGSERIFELQKQGDETEAEGAEVGVQGGKERVGFDGSNKSRISLRLAAGSALLMAGDTQEKWLHQLPSEDGAGQRISLTFRSIVPGFEEALQDEPMSSCTKWPQGSSQLAARSRHCMPRGARAA